MIHHPADFSSVSVFSLLACLISHLLGCLHRGSTPQASNGPSGSYACSLPATPVVSHRELRVAQSEAGGSLTSRSLKNIPRRPSLFKVSRPHPLSSLAPPPSIAPPPRSALLLLLPVKAPLSALFQNRDSDKKAAEGKGEAAAVRGVPIKQVCGPISPVCLLLRAVRASLAFASWTEHPVEAERQLSEQRVEEEVGHAVQQRDSVLPLQRQRKDGPGGSARLPALILTHVSPAAFRITRRTSTGRRWTCCA